MCAERGVNSAKPLFSHTRITGSAHSAARLTDSLKVSGLDGAVAEEHDGHEIGAVEARRERVAERQRDVAADHAGGAEQPVVAIDEVHRPAEAVAQPRRAPHQLGHQPVQRRALGDRVAVRAMTAVEGVTVPQLPAHRRRRRPRLRC